MSLKPMSSNNQVSNWQNVLCPCVSRPRLWQNALLQLPMTQCINAKSVLKVNALHYVSLTSKCPIICCKLSKNEIAELAIDLNARA
jgi:hypothetical protein